MSMGGSKPAPPPATRPERVVDTRPDDIKLGTEDAFDGIENKKTGKRSLLRPTGGDLSGVNAK